MTTAAHDSLMDAIVLKELRPSGYSEPKNAYGFIPPLNAGIGVRGHILTHKEHLNDMTYSLSSSGISSLPKQYSWLNAADYKKYHGIEKEIGIQCRAIHQHNCGSCWAIAATTSFCDRWVIANRAEFNPMFSYSDLLVCCKGDETSLCNGNSGCCGGILYNAGRFITEVGLPKWTCVDDSWLCPRDDLEEKGDADLVHKIQHDDDENPAIIYSGCSHGLVDLGGPATKKHPCSICMADELLNKSCAEINKYIPKCTNKCRHDCKLDKNGKLVCKSDQPFVRYKGAKGTVVTIGDPTNNPIAHIKNNIFSYGPVAATYMVFADFVIGSSPEAYSDADGFKATKGIYVHVPGLKVYPYKKISTKSCVKALDSDNILCDPRCNEPPLWKCNRKCNQCKDENGKECDCNCLEDKDGHKVCKDKCAYKLSTNPTVEPHLGYLGNHSIVIVGWGVEKDVTVSGTTQKGERVTKHFPEMPYWIVRNSWGPCWMHKYSDDLKKNPWGAPKGFIKVAMYQKDAIRTNMGINDLLYMDHIGLELNPITGKLEKIGGAVSFQVQSHAEPHPGPPHHQPKPGQKVPSQGHHSNGQSNGQSTYWNIPLVPPDAKVMPHWKDEPKEHRSGIVVTPQGVDGKSKPTPTVAPKPDSPDDLPSWIPWVVLGAFVLIGIIIFWFYWNKTPVHAAQLKPGEISPLMMTGEVSPSPGIQPGAKVGEYSPAVPVKTMVPPPTPVLGVAQPSPSPKTLPPPSTLVGVAEPSPTPRTPPVTVIGAAQPSPTPPVQTPPPPVQAVPVQPLKPVTPPAPVTTIPVTTTPVTKVVVPPITPPVSQPVPSQPPATTGNALTPPPPLFGSGSFIEVRNMTDSIANTPMQPRGILKHSATLPTYYK